MKVLGNSKFKEGKIQEALEKWQSTRVVSFPCPLLTLICNPFLEGIRYLDVHPYLPEETEPEIQKPFSELLISLLLNSSLAAYKVGGADNAQLAVSWTTRVLQRLPPSDGDKAKALYRRAISNVVLHEDDDAEKDLLEALTLTPNDQACLRELNGVRERKKAEKERQKKAFRGMFS